MERHLVAPVESIPDGGRLKIEVAGRSIVVFNVGGSFYALADRCPHQGGSLSKGDQIGELRARGAGRVSYCRRNMIIRCPWHHWAFDIETGRSQIDPARVRVRAYETAVAPAGSCVPETVPAATTFETRQEGGQVYVLLDRPLSPQGVAAPFGRYVHGIEIPAGARIVMTSGQLALAADGTVPEGMAEQTALCLENIEKILAEAGMSRADIVKLSAFVTDRAHMAGYMQARDNFFRSVEPPPASTLLIVNGFTRPEFLVEIEAIAAK